MKRLSADEYLAMIRNADRWSVMKDWRPGEVLLTVMENDEPVTYLGPNPLEGPLGELVSFFFDLEVLTKPTIGDVDMSLPKLGVIEFVENIVKAAKWTTIVHDKEGVVELLVLTRECRFKRYLSHSFRKMPADRADAFLSMLEAMNKEKK